MFALDPGDVVELDFHFLDDDGERQDMFSYPYYRITSWRLNRNYTIEWEAVEHRPAIYQFLPGMAIDIDPDRKDEEINDIDLPLYVYPTDFVDLDWSALRNLGKPEEGVELFGDSASRTVNFEWREQGTHKVVATAKFRVTNMQFPDGDYGLFRTLQSSQVLIDTEELVLFEGAPDIPIGLNAGAPTATTVPLQFDPVPGAQFYVIRIMEKE